MTENAGERVAPPSPDIVIITRHVPVRAVHGGNARTSACSSWTTCRPRLLPDELRNLARPRVPRGRRQRGHRVDWRRGVVSTDLGPRSPHSARGEAAAWLRMAVRRGVRRVLVQRFDNVRKAGTPCRAGTILDGIIARARACCARSVSTPDIVSNVLA